MDKRTFSSSLYIAYPFKQTNKILLLKKREKKPTSWVETYKLKVKGVKGYTCKQKKPVRAATLLSDKGAVQSSL